MKNVVILHGSGENDQSFWFPYLTRELTQKGYTVSIPLLPDGDDPDLAKQLPVALKETYTSETILIGHSSGCPLMLSVLENIDTTVAQAIMVSGYARPIGEKKEPLKILQDSYNWEKIKSHAREFIFLNSDNDPWGCDDTEGEYLKSHLGGQLIVMSGEGHMGSDTFKQPYKEFPFLLHLIK